MPPSISFSTRPSFDSVTRRLVVGFRTALMMLVALTAGSSRAAAQTGPVEVGGHVGVLRLGELDTTDTGIGTDVVWHLAPSLAVDGAFTWFPGADTFTGGSSRRQQRTLGLAGLRTGVALGIVDLFGRARAGYLRFGQGPPTVCIAIFPTPLVCQLSGGYTAFAAEFGGGASFGLIPSGRLRATIEAGDLLVRYGFTSLRPNGSTSEGFFSHNLLIGIGAAWRF
jgi:hypothetical protein